MSSTDVTAKILDFGEVQLKTISGVISAMYNASKSSKLMSIVSALFTVDLWSKIGLIYPATAQIVREGIVQAMNLQFRTQDLQNKREWESLIPILGFLEPANKTTVETILDTSVTVDAAGGSATEAMGTL